MLKSAVLSFICLSLLWGNTVFAADERFTVEIKVDVTDENASIAREKAMNNATRAAITAVARRISTTDGAAQIASMTDAQLINFVKETSVVDEKNSDVRYMADLRIVINEELLKEYMKEREIPMLTQTNVSVLIVPVFREFADDAPMLWEVDNPWKKAWENSTASSAIRFIPISGSAGNISALDAKQAAVADAAGLEKVMHMAGANDVYVLDASYNGIEGLDINATSLSGRKSVIKVAGAKSSGEQLFNQAVIETRNQLEQQILSDSAATNAEENELTILYPFTALGNWITAERLIKSFAEVSNMQVQAMAPGKAQFKISYSGSFDNLQRQFRIKGYRLEDGGNYMIMSDIGD